MRNKKLVIVLVGTHGSFYHNFPRTNFFLADKDSDREVGTGTAEALARPWGISCREVSSKTGQNIPDLFDDLAKQCINLGSIFHTCLIYLHLGLGTKNSVKKTSAHNNHILKVVKKNDSLAKMLPFFAADEKSKLLDNWDKVYHHPYDWSDLDV